MKKLTTISLLLISSKIACLGQVSGFEFTPSHLKGYKKIVTISLPLSSSIDSIQERTLYHIDKSGRITLVESFEKGKKVHLGRHAYTAKGQLKTVENHNQVYAYDEKATDHVPALREDTYFLTSMEYKNGLLYKELEYTYFMGTGSLNSVRQYEYDRQGNKIKETYTNLYEGLVVAFESNTDLVDSIYHKGEAERTSSTFSYANNRMVATHLDAKGQIKSYAYVTLNSKGRPVDVKLKDKDGSEIESISYTYNKDGNLVRRRRYVADRLKFKGDTLEEDDYRIMYGKNKLPSEVTTFYNGQAVSKFRLTYQ